MDILLLDGSNETDWNAFCLQSSDTWFWHTTYWINYVLHYRPDLNPRQMSFLVRENNNYVAVCPLILESNDGNDEFSFSSFAIPSPATIGTIAEKKRRKVLDFVFDYIDCQAQSLGVKKASFRFSPLADLATQKNGFPTNYLLRYGYLDATFNTQIIDVSPDPEQLRSDVRKGHKYDINRASRILETHTFDETSVDRATFELYRELHHKDAGRVTRPQITFDMMYDWIKQGYAILVGTRMRGESEFIGFSYHIIYKDGAYYASACSDPDYNELPIAHCLLWESMRWLHNKGIKYFELGWQFYGSEFHHHVSEKECQISKFKRGFGGDQVLQIVGEKYYDPHFFEKEYRTKVEHYKTYIRNTRHGSTFAVPTA